MKIAQKRKAGEMLGRSGIASRIIALAEDIANGSYKNAIERAGQISVLIDSASYDDYWDEKASIGKWREQDIFINMIGGDIQVERVKRFINPHDPV